jgi:hypothetical protein
MFAARVKERVGADDKPLMNANVKEDATHVGTHVGRMNGQRVQPIELNIAVG